MNTFGGLVFVGLVAYVTSAIMVGAPSGVDVNDANIQRMARFAAGEIGDEYELVRVIAATQQIVNGRLYEMELVARRRIPGQKNKRRQCKVLVYEILHEGYLELEEFHCHFTNKQPRL